MSKQAKQLIFKVPIYVEDIHFDDILYHLNYLKYADRARSEWLKQINLKYSDMNNNGILLAISTIDIKFVAPGCLDDTAVVTTNFSNLKHTTFIVDQTISSMAKQYIMCRISTKMACVCRKQNGTYAPYKLAEAFPAVAQDIKNRIEQSGSNER